MSRLVPLCVLLGTPLAACNSTDDTGPAGDVDAGDTDTAEPLPTTTDTSWPPGDEGSMMVVEDRRGLGLYAVFVNQQPGFENLAYCAVTGSVCVNGFPPAPDQGMPFSVSTVFDPAFSQYSYVGDTVSLGPWVAELYYNEETGLAYYYADLDGEDPLLGPVGVSFGVQWGEYVGESDIVLREPLEMVVPRENQLLRTVNARSVVIEWVPVEGGGDVHLFANTAEPNFTAYQWWLEDDGYFEVPIDDLMLGGIDSEDAVSFTLQRWNRGQVTHHGHTLDIVQLTDLTFFVDYDYVGSRSEIEPADNCAEAVNMASPVAGAGTFAFWGRMTGFANDLGDQCGIGSTDAEGLVPVTLPPLSALSVEYNLPLADEVGGVRDAAVWITDDCSDSDACLAGSNVNDDWVSELTAYFNTSETETQTVYIVLGGSAGSSSDVFLLDVSVQTLSEPDLADECLEATQSDPMPEGSYYSEETAYLDSLNPGLSCTNSQTPGPDAMRKVNLLDGQTLTAFLEMPGADPAIYLMYNCTQPNTCAIGADATLGPNEVLVYTNVSGASENLYLVIDTKGAPMQPYFLTLDITP